MRSISWSIPVLAMSVVLFSGMNQAPGQGERGPGKIENENLSVTLDDQTGMFTVLDKRANVKWVQFSEKQQIRTQKPRELLRIKKADGKIIIDGNLADWTNAAPITITCDMITEVKAVSGDTDLGASAYVLWDDQYVYIAAKATDDKLVFRDTSKADKDMLKWWERDSIEIWVGGVQVGFVLNPGKSIVTLTRGELSDCQIAVKEAGGGSGYVVEAAIPIRHFPDLAGKAQVGRRVGFAFGVNDADATGSREGQIYYPRSWQHSRVETFADAILADAKGEVSREQMEKAMEEPGGAIRNIKSIDAPHPGICFDTEIEAGRGVQLPVTVRVMLPKNASDVGVEIEGPNDTEVGSIDYPLPLVPEKGESWLALSPYSDGLLVQLRADKLPRRGWGSDMPFFGVTNIEAGYGYDCIFETPDDVRMTMKPVSRDKDAKMAAGLAWQPSMGKWRHTRKVVYRFCPAGGYVALAKAYRNYAKATGVLKTLREKMKQRPDVAKLMGAPDIWGANGLKFCEEAKAAGMDRMLVNGSWGVKQTEEIKKLGYLASVYDNYEDMMAGKANRYGDCKIPDDAPLLANGQRMLGWPAHETDPKTGRTKIDPKTGKPSIKEQFYKRCSALDLPVAKRWIPPDQVENPRNARFLDVTTATGLRECYDPNHYCTRTIDREYRQQLASYVGDGLGLVLGGEHGMWWGVPQYDYWEGMQSGGFYSWPAGHVGMDLPKSREEIGKDYQEYGIGPYYRIPFWELVFGDCVVSYWYWGDSTGHLYAVAPEISYKKDLFNMLYANPPLYWVSQPYSFKWNAPELRARLLESYRNTCKLHEQIGFDEMLNHQWLTEDRTVQKTVFSSGAFVVVNFDEKKTYDLKDGEQTWTLSALGFFAQGPNILQYRILKDGRNVTYIKTPDYLFADAAGKPNDFGGVVTASPATIRIAGPDELKIIVAEARAPVQVRPAQIVPNWDMASTHVLLLDNSGRRVAEVFPDVKNGDAIVFTEGGAFEVVCGKEHDLPSLALDVQRITVSPPDTLRKEYAINAPIANLGKVKADDVSVAFYLETMSPDGLIDTKKISLDGGKSAAVSCSLDTSNLDGPRKIIIAVDPENKIAELIENDNVGDMTITIPPDHSRWRCKLNVEAANGKTDQENVPVVLAVDFGKELKRLGVAGTLDASSIRVCEKNKDGSPGRPMLCQFDPARDFDAKANPGGEVVWLIPGKLASGAKAQFLLFFDTVENGTKRGFYGKVWDAGATTASTEGYTAVFRDGCIVELYDKLGSEKNGSILTGLIYSSGQTGWTREEDGVVEGMEVLSNGPLRAVVLVRKRLRAGMNYEKTYSFYPRRFDVHFKGNKPYGVISRAYYGLEGTYEDSLGHKAKVDGTGNGEDVSGKCPNPKYYVVYAPGWAHSCIALTPFSNMTYWDAGSWGGIGLSGGDISNAKMSYVMHPGEKDGAFGGVDCNRLHDPPKAQVVP